jgi:integrase
MGKSIALLAARDVVPKLQQLVRDDKITSAKRNPVYLRAVRRYLAEVGIETRDWLAGYQEPKPSKKLGHQAPRIPEVQDIISVAQAELSPTWANLIALTILTGCRIGEMTDLRFSEVTVDDEDRPMLVIPAERMKGGVEQPIPLTSQMLTILGAQRAVHEADDFSSDYVFTSTKGVRPIYQLPTKVKNLVMPNEVSMHDFRRSLRSNIAGRWDEDLCEVLLAHARPGITGVYNKSARLTDRLEVLTWWNAQVMPPASNAE